jgi:signal transduction histidine kinase
MTLQALARAANPLSWSLSAKVPLLVALLMFAVSAVITNRVQERLAVTQEQYLQQLSSAYLDGLSASLLPSVVREDVWEVFDTLDRARERYKGLAIRWTAVTNGADSVLAASDPTRFPSSQRLPSDVARRFEGNRDVAIDEANATAFLVRPLSYQDRQIGTIYAEADIGALLAERSEVFWTLLITNLVLTMMLATAGYLAVRRMVRPVAILSDHLDRSMHGRIEAVPDHILSEQNREFRRLFARYNAMTDAVNERESLAVELAEEEKLASLGRLASGMAHEINNPLGGMFNALDSLKRHGGQESVRSTSIRLLEQGLSGIRDLVRSTLATYRADQRPRDLTVIDIDDLRLLISPEIRRKRIGLVWENALTAPVEVPAIPARDAILNLLLNACAASPEGSEISFSVIGAGDELAVEIADRGPGLPPHVREYLERKGAGSAPLDRRSGLGLWIVKRLCDEMEGSLNVVKSGRTGTTIRLTIKVKAMDLKDVA